MVQKLLIFGDLSPTGDLLLLYVWLHLKYQFYHACCVAYHLIAFLSFFLQLSWSCWRIQTGVSRHAQATRNDLWQHDRRLNLSILELILIIIIISLFGSSGNIWTCRCSNVRLFSTVHEICMDGATPQLPTSCLSCIKWDCTDVSILTLGKGSRVSNHPSNLIELYDCFLFMFVILVNSTTVSPSWEGLWTNKRKRK